MITFNRITGSFSFGIQCHETGRSLKGHVKRYLKQVLEAATEIIVIISLLNPVTQVRNPAIWVVFMWDASN